MDVHNQALADYTEIIGKLPTYIPLSSFRAFCTIAALPSPIYLLSPLPHFQSSPCLWPELIPFFTFQGIHVCLLPILTILTSRVPYVVSRFSSICCLPSPYNPIVLHPPVLLFYVSHTQLFSIASRYLHPKSSNILASSQTLASSINWSNSVFQKLIDQFRLNK